MNTKSLKQKKEGKVKSLGKSEEKIPMMTISDRLRERSDASPHQKFFNPGLKQNSKKTRKHSRTAFRKAKKMANSYMNNAKSIVESSPSYVKVYDKDRPHMLQTMTPMSSNRQNPKKMKSKSYTVT